MSKAETKFPKEALKTKRLTPEGAKFILDRRNKVIEISNKPVENEIILNRNQEKPDLSQGMLVHGTMFDLDTLQSIARSGVLSGEFFGIEEDGETHFCADFFKIPYDMSVEDYFEWIEQREKNQDSRVKKPKPEKSKLTRAGDAKPFRVTFIFNTHNPYMNELLQYDAYTGAKAHITRGIINQLPFKPDDHRFQRLATIPYGVPANLIAGIILPRPIAHNPSLLLRVQNMFKDAVVFDSSGKNVTMDQPRIKYLHGSIWIDEMQNGMIIPVGGFGEAWTDLLELDFGTFEQTIEQELKQYTMSYDQQFRESLTSYVKRYNLPIKPFTLFTFFISQIIAFRVLELDNIEEILQQSPLRADAYQDRTPRLSEMKGMAQCAEIAALAKYILDKIGINTSYISGVRVTHQQAEKHSYLVLNNGELIMDVANLRVGTNGGKIPAIYIPAVPITPDILSSPNSILVEARSIMPDDEPVFFGASDSPSLFVSDVIYTSGKKASNMPLNSIHAHK